MEQITYSVRHTMWKGIMLQFQNPPDGMSAKKWMNENQISEKSYYYWQQNFRMTYRLPFYHEFRWRYSSCCTCMWNHQSQKRYRWIGNDYW